MEQPTPVSNKKPASYTALKILLALLPTLVFTQNFAWMTLNKHMALGFLAIWAITVWSCWKLTEKNHVLERLFRLTEIAFFLLPVSAIILSFMFGSKVSEAAKQGGAGAQAGASIGVAIGSTFAVGVAFVIGLVGGIIFHLVTGKYEKRADASGVKHAPTLANKHGVILALVGVLLTAMIANAIPEQQTTTDSSTSGTNKAAPVGAAAESASAPSPAQPQQAAPQVVQNDKNCPAMTKIGQFEFEWNNDTEGNRRLWLSAGFLKPAVFSDGWELTKLPDTENMFMQDNFVCQKGAVAGESIKKLYCRPTWTYDPELKKNEIDAQGNIVKTDYLHIKAVVFDIAATDIENVSALQKLPIESTECDSSRF